MIFTKVKRLMHGISRKAGETKTKLMLPASNKNASPVLKVKEKIFCLVSTVIASIQGFTVTALADTGSDLSTQIGNVTTKFFGTFGGPISKLGILIGVVGLAGMFLTQDKKREAFKAVFIGGVVAFILFVNGDSSIAKSIFDAVAELGNK